MVLPSGEAIAVLGQGTWHFGEHRARRSDEIASLRLGLDLGMTVIDTAEMYGDGLSETVVGEAIAGRRDEVFLVDKVLPQHATRVGTVRGCKASLDRLDTDHIDLYLLHWRGKVPLAETVMGFADLLAAGLIRYWGVSNLDVDDMAELTGVPGGDGVQTDQILYNLMRRGPEYELILWLSEHGTPIMPTRPSSKGVCSTTRCWMRSRGATLRRRHRSRWRGCYATPASTPSHALDACACSGKCRRS